MGEIDELLTNSSKAALIEAFTGALEEEGTRIAVVIMRDKRPGELTIQTMFWDVDSKAEADFMYDLAKDDLQYDDNIWEVSP